MGVEPMAYRLGGDRSIHLSHSPSSYIYYSTEKDHILLMEVKYF
jgi:hypothetical protein